MDEEAAYHQAHGKGFRAGTKAERQLIIELWYREMACNCEDPMRHLLTRIKGEN